MAEKGPNEPIRLTREATAAVESILSRGGRVEIGRRNGKICVWEIRSKTKHEEPIA